MECDWSRMSQLVNKSILGFLLLSVCVRDSFHAVEGFEEGFHGSASAGRAAADVYLRGEQLKSAPFRVASGFAQETHTKIGTLSTSAFTRISDRILLLSDSLKYYAHPAPDKATREGLTDVETLLRIDVSNLVKSIESLRTQALGSHQLGNHPEMVQNQKMFSKHWTSLSYRLSAGMENWNSIPLMPVYVKAFFSTLSYLLESKLLTSEIFRKEIFSSPHFMELLVAHIQQETATFMALGLNLKVAVSADQRLEHLSGIFNDMEPRGWKNLVCSLIVQINDNLPQHDQLCEQSTILFSSVMPMFEKHRTLAAMKKESSRELIPEIANKLIQLLKWAYPNVPQSEKANSALIVYYSTLYRVLSYILQFSSAQVKKTVAKTLPSGRENSATHSSRSQSSLVPPESTESELWGKLNFIQRLVDLADTSRRWKWQVDIPGDFLNAKVADRFEISDHASNRAPDYLDVIRGNSLAMLQEEFNTFNNPEKLKASFVPEAQNWVEEPAFKSLLSMVDRNLKAASQVAS